MDKEEFEDKIVQLLIETGYMNKNNFLDKVTIHIEKGMMPEVDIKFVVRSK